MRNREIRLEEEPRQRVVDAGHESHPSPEVVTDLHKEVATYQAQVTRMDLHHIILSDGL